VEFPHSVFASKPFDFGDDGGTDAAPCGARQHVSGAQLRVLTISAPTPTGSPSSSAIDRISLSWF
jgi:hypothetical protein